MSTIPSTLPRWTLALGLCGLLAAPVSASDRLAVRGGTVLHPDGSEMAGATVLVEDGIIKAVGPDVEIPYDATVIDAEGKVVFPGLVVAHTSGGLDSANERVSVTPFVDVYDAVDPNSLVFEEALRAGSTTLHVIQGNDTVMGGLSRVVRPIGVMVEDMTVRPQLALKMCITPKRGFNRMTQMAELRKAFTSLENHIRDVAEKRYEEEQEKADKKVLVPPDEAAEKGMEHVTVDDLDPQWRNLYDLTQGQLQVFLYCEQAADVERGIAFMEERELLDQTVFVLGSHAHKAVDALKKAGRPVVLSGSLIYRETDPLTGEESETFVPKVFADAEMPFALQTSSGSMGESFLWYQAARLVRAGLARAVALQSITQWPADLLGMGDKAGSIAAGKLGNLLVLSGDPLAQSTMVEQVVIEGQLVYERDKDRRLQELLSGEEIPEAAAPDAEN
jgi:imidazolonepropionase-like amidohydrolase